MKEIFHLLLMLGDEIDCFRHIWITHSNGTIWALLAFGLFRVKKRIEKGNEKYQTLFSLFKNALSANEDQTMINNLYFSVNLLLNRFQRQLNSLYHGRIITIVVFLIFSYFAFNNQNPYDGAILLIFYAILIGFETFSIYRISNRIDKLELNIAEALGQKVEPLANAVNK